MRIAFAAALLVACFVAGPAPAQILKNVSNFDSALLVGKTCKGTFSTGGSGERAMGATHFQFFARDGELAMRHWRRFGRAAFEKPDFDMAASEELNPPRSVAADGGKISIATAEQYQMSLTYSGGSLTGEVDPRRGNPPLSNVAKMALICK